MKKGDCAVYWLKAPGGMGKVKKRGTRQVCEQYQREQLAKANVQDGWPKYIIIDDPTDPRLNHRGEE